MVRDGSGWDEPPSQGTMQQWEKWRGQLVDLAQISVPRCYKDKSMKNIVKRELHHFSDASQKGYGQSSYLRQVDSEGQVCCTLVMAKARVPPSKVATIPRMELTASVISVKTANLLQKEMDVKEIPTDNYYWTDSTALRMSHEDSMCLLQTECSTFRISRILHIGTMLNQDRTLQI
jgi:hypothetical protein